MRQAQSVLKSGLLAAIAGLSAIGPACAAGNPSVGAAISGRCAVCHGSDGFSVAASIPNLAGQHYVYLLRQLNAFKDGERKNPLMDSMARNLTEQQAQDIASYFASIPIKIARPARQFAAAKRPARPAQ